MLGLGFAEWRRQVQLAIALSKLAKGQSFSSVAHCLGYRCRRGADLYRGETCGRRAAPSASG
ncbi:hypothetical protein L3V59_39465 [Burkholderia aenigmatica]|uniref:hypothetical protein n=1 Tax=Burkholderia aenigmatica TaxID=2015348 RepID=UPI001F1E12FB|nr:MULTISPECIES: hypothetical protein [Burkholderia cepacia complex]UKD17795.1 hypothetical protein L3V59_39465 [Burkholderia aenigmatica]